MGVVHYIQLMDLQLQHSEAKESETENTYVYVYTSLHSVHARTSDF